MPAPVSIHARNALVLAGGLLGAAPLGWHVVASLALGGGMQVVNLRGLERSVRGMLGLAAQGQTYGARALVAVRWALFLGAVVLALTTLPLEPIAFLVGLSTVVPAVIWHGFATAGQRAPEV